MVAQVLLDLGLHVAFHGALMLLIPALGGKAHIVHDVHLDFVAVTTLGVGGEALCQALLDTGDAAKLRAVYEFAEKETAAE